jgi:hypothetical protein
MRTLVVAVPSRSVLEDPVVAAEAGGRSEAARLVAVVVLALLAVAAAAVGIVTGRQSPASTTGPQPSAPVWCEAESADACGRWDQPPLDPG